MDEKNVFQTKLIEWIKCSPFTSSSSKPTHLTKNTLQRQIEATDKQIDELVYELYGLTEEEIRVVEGQSDPDDSNPGT